MQSNSLTSSGFTLFISGNDTLSLRAGDMVKAEVMTSGPDNTASIKLNNKVLTVTTEVPVRKGEMLSLRVEKQENAVYLRLAGNRVESAQSVKSSVLPSLDRFRELLPGAEGMIRLVGLLSNIPAGLRANMPEIELVERFLLMMNRITGTALKEALQNGGIFFETKLRILALGMDADSAMSDIEEKHIIAGDLKAALLRLKDTVLRPGFLDLIASTLKPKELIETLNSVLSNIEFYQLQSKLTDSLQFFLPLIWKELRDGELIFRESDSGKPGENSFSCSINLDLERTGKIRVNLLLQRGYVHVVCAAENKIFSGLLQESYGLIEKRFESSGLRIGSLTVQHQERIDFGIDRAAGLSIRA